MQSVTQAALTARCEPAQLLERDPWSAAMEEIGLTLKTEQGNVDDDDATKKEEEAVVGEPNEMKPEHEANSLTEMPQVTQIARALPDPNKLQKFINAARSLVDAHIVLIPETAPKAVIESTLRSSEAGKYRGDPLKLTYRGIFFDPKLQGAWHVMLNEISGNPQGCAFKKTRILNS